MNKRIIYVLSIFLCLSLSGCYTVVKHPLLRTEERPDECFRGGYYPATDYYWGFYTDYYWHYDRWGYYYDWPWWYEPYWWYHEGENADHRSWDKFERRRDPSTADHEQGYRNLDKGSSSEKVETEAGQKVEEKKTDKKSGRRRQR